MAIYYVRVSTIGAKQGSIVNAAAYRSAEKLRRNKTGEIANYTRKQGVAATGIIAPDNALGWVYQRQLLWNMVEESEKRKDARYGREIVLALPHELTLEKNEELVKSYIRENFIPLGMVADYAIHIPSADSNNGCNDGDNNLIDQRNIHVHILLTDRPLDGKGFSKKKDRSWNDKELVEAWRKNWAASLNRKLKDEGIDHPELDHRSYQRQGSTKIAQNHEGKFVTALRRQIKFNKEKFSEAARIIELNDLSRRYNQTVDAIVATSAQNNQQSDTADSSTKTTKYPNTQLINPLIDTISTSANKSNPVLSSKTRQDTKPHKFQEWIDSEPVQDSPDGQDSNYKLKPDRFRQQQLDRHTEFQHTEQISTTDSSEKSAENTELEALQKAFETQNRYRSIDNRAPRTAADEYRLKLAEITSKFKPERVAKHFRKGSPTALNFEMLIRAYLKRQGFNAQQIRKAMRTASPALYKKSENAARIYAQKFKSLFGKVEQGSNSMLGNG